MTIDTSILLQTTVHPKLLADNADIALATEQIARYPWYRHLYEKKKAEIDQFLERPIYISPLKQAYEYPYYDCLKHKVQLRFEDNSPFEHRCPVDGEVFTGEKYDAAWAGWYHGLLSRRLIWIGTIYQITREERYAEAVRDVLVRFGDTYQNYPNENNILGPARVFFGTLGESIFGTNIALAYDLVYESACFSLDDHRKIRDQFLHPLAELATQFDETVSNRQSWYNNAVASIGFVTNTKELLEWAFNGQRGFLYQLTIGLPKSGFWYEGPGYHFFTLEGFILLAEMARHHGLDIYRLEIAGHSIRKMFDAPLGFLAPDFTFPRIKDSGGGSIFSPEKIAKYEVGYARYGDERYGQLLKYAYEQKEIERELEFFFVCNPELPKEQRPIYPSTSTNLEGNGCAILRARFDDDEKFVYLDYGTVGGEHGHPDRLGIGYFAHGRHWILDPLNQDYFKPNLQTWFRQSIAHNTVVINQSNQAWANGNLNFFGETSGFKIASGSSDRIYAGAFIRRTVALLGEYFIDLCEVRAEEERIVDYPIHSFGTLAIQGVNLSKRPDVLFGKAPGIPGYDQFTEIHSGLSDKGWRADFRMAESAGLMVHVLGEPGSQIFSVMTPGIREDYEKRLPMVFCRRITDETTFVSLLEAYREVPKVKGFDSLSNNTYEVLLEDCRHSVHLDPALNSYWRVEYQADRIVQVDALHVKRIDLGARTILESAFPVEKISLHFDGDVLMVDISGNYSEIRLSGFQIQELILNGERQPFTEVEDSIILYPTEKDEVQYLGEKQIDLFIGLESNLRLPVGNTSSEPRPISVRLEPRPGWKDDVEAQVNDWGGIVNLLPLHKNSTERRVYPEVLGVDSKWLEELGTQEVVVPAGGHIEASFRANLPNDLHPATYPAHVLLEDTPYPAEVRIREPLSVSLYLANSVKNTLRCKLVNNTVSRLQSSVNLFPGPMWKCEQSQWRVDLPPLGRTSVDIPILHTIYVVDHQKSPIEIEIRSGDFIRRWARDFYVGYCFKANEPPALDGTFTNWDTGAPLLIDSQEQIARLLFGNRPWKGPTDLSAKVYTLYDEEYFYVGAEVIDDVVSIEFDSKTQMPSDFDSIEIILDTRTNSEQGQDPPTPGVFRHVAVPGRPQIVFDEEVKGDIPVRFRQIKDAETFWKRTEKGYNIAVRIPWRSLPGVQPEPGAKIGFDLALNDNDGTRYRTNQMLWAGFNQNQTWLDLSLIGALLFR